MKLTPLLFLLLLCQLVRANEIDSLKTNADVQQFLVTKVDTEFAHELIFRKYTNDTSAYGKNKFFKLDLDNNGLTDLIINGTELLAVTDSGNGVYHIHLLDVRNFGEDRHNLVNIITTGKQPLLVTYSYDDWPGWSNDRDRDSLVMKSAASAKNDTVITRMGNFTTYAVTPLHFKTDTFIYLFSSFIEYNTRPDDLKIEKIVFNTSPCFGSCPVFELATGPDKIIKYHAWGDNPVEGKFTSLLTEAAYKQLAETINYMHLTTLKDEYRVNWTDDATYDLEITYNNGHIKKISDYGGLGTYGLQNLYNQFFKIRKTQQWQPE